ncbi:hypothetical protein SprV_0301220700 [Sparganum proliferum]
MAHSLVNFFHNLDFCELFVLPSDPSPISDERFLGTNFLEQVILRLELADILLQVLVLSGQHQERAQLEYPTDGSPKSLLDCIEAEGNHKLTFEVFVLIDQPSNFPSKGEPVSSWQVAVRVLFNDGAAETVKYIQQFAKILSTAVSIAEVATHMATIILLHLPSLHPPVVRNANGTSHTLAHLLIELFGLLFVPRSPEEGQVILRHVSKGEKRTFQHFHRDVATFFRNAPSFDVEFQQDVTNGLLEVANKFLDLPTASFAFLAPYLDVFTGERARICIWLGIMRFLVHFLYAAPSSDPERTARLRDAFASRLVLSILDLIEAQMFVEDCRSLALLLITLSEILTCIAEEPSNNKEVECQWHNCSVYLLVELRCRVGDKSSGYWGLILTKITECLDTLFLSGKGSRFAHCICLLDDLPESSDFAKYRATIEKACTCARTSLSGRHTKTDGEAKQKPEVLRVLPYMRNVSEATERMLRPLNVGVGHRPEATIRRLVMQPKSRLPPEDMSGVIYRVNCLDCQANYCGLTNKRLKTRMHEHTLAIKRKDARSHVAMHSLENGHWFDFDGAQVLGRAENRLAREIIEAWQTDANSINRSVELPAPYEAAKHYLRTRGGPMRIEIDGPIRREREGPI